MRVETMPPMAELSRRAVDSVGLQEGRALCVAPVACSCTRVPTRSDLGTHHGPMLPTKSQPRTGHTRRTETRRTQKPNRTLGRSQDAALTETHIGHHGNSCTRSEVGQDQPIRSVLNPDDLRLVLRLRVVLVQGLQPETLRAERGVRPSSLEVIEQHVACLTQSRSVRRSTAPGAPR